MRWNIINNAKVYGDYKLDLAEYSALHDEQLQRIALMSKHSISAVTLIIAMWAAGFTLMGIRLGRPVGAEFTIYEKAGLCFGEALAFFSVIPILCSLAIKSGENIRQIAAIGSYIKVFFEYIPKHTNHGLQHLHWETYDTKVNIMKQNRFNYIKLYNREYCYLSIVSFVFWGVSLISYGFTVSSNIYNCKLMTLAVISAVLFIVMACCGVTFIRIIIKETSVDTVFTKHSKTTMVCFLEEAVADGYLDENEKNEAIGELCI